MTPTPRRRDESGAALVLAIAVLIVIGVMSTALLNTITSGVENRSTLDTARDREYAADAAIEYAVTQVRQLGGAGAGLAMCSPQSRSGVPYYTYTLNGYAINVDCINAATLTTSLLLQRNVIFVACDNVGLSCDDSAADVRRHSIIRAQVNFEATASRSPIVTRTYTQAWSVNR